MGPTSTDLLATVLRDTGLSRRLLDLSTLTDVSALRFPCERSVGLHAVLRGPLYLHEASLTQPLPLDSGDVVLMARGCDHALSLRPSVQGQRLERIDVRAAVAAADTPGAETVVSGAYQFWHMPLHPFFAEMPRWTVLRASEMPRLGPLALLVGLLAEELRGAAPGSQIVVHGLLDVVFSYVLRELVARRATVPGWSQAVLDPQVGRVLALMHGDLAQPWTLDSLARRAAMSRTSLAERFREAMGDTPLNHLRTLRMQRATRLLAETRQSLEAVATAVAYRDAFSFSKVFKRTVGLSPKAFRQLDAAQSDPALRFAAR